MLGLGSILCASTFIGAPGTLFPLNAPSLFLLLGFTSTRVTRGCLRGLSSGYCRRIGGLDPGTVSGSLGLHLVRIGELPCLALLGCLTAALAPFQPFMVTLGIGSLMDAVTF